MTWGGLTTMCILPYAWSCQPPTCMNCQRSNRHNPQPSSYLQTLLNVFVELLEELEWLKYIHVWLTVGVEIMFAHALSFSQCLRKKIISIYEFINLKQSLSLWIHSFSSDHSEFFAASTSSCCTNMVLLTDNYYIMNWAPVLIFASARFDGFALVALLLATCCLDQPSFITRTSNTTVLSYQLASHPDSEGII